jgi:hypothetical protein
MGVTTDTDVLSITERQNREATEARHRNENWNGGDFNQFVLDYARILEVESNHGT